MIYQNLFIPFLAATRAHHPSACLPVELQHHCYTWYAINSQLPRTLARRFCHRHLTIKQHAKDCSKITLAETSTVINIALKNCSGREEVFPLLGERRASPTPERNTFFPLLGERTAFPIFGREDFSNSWREREKSFPYYWERDKLFLLLGERRAYSCPRR